MLGSFGSTRPPQFERYHAYSPSRASSSPKHHFVDEPARHAYSHCASLGMKYFGPVVAAFSLATNTVVSLARMRRHMMRWVAHDHDMWGSAPQAPPPLPQNARVQGRPGHVRGESGTGSDVDAHWLRAGDPSGFAQRPADTSS